MVLQGVRSSAAGLSLQCPLALRADAHALHCHCIRHRLFVVHGSATCGAAVHRLPGPAASASLALGSAGHVGRAVRDPVAPPGGATGPGRPLGRTGRYRGADRAERRVLLAGTWTAAPIRLALASTGMGLSGAGCGCCIGRPCTVFAGSGDAGWPDDQCAHDLAAVSRARPATPVSGGDTRTGC